MRGEKTFRQKKTLFSQYEEKNNVPSAEQRRPHGPQRVRVARPVIHLFTTLGGLPIHLRRPDRDDRNPLDVRAGHAGVRKLRVGLHGVGDLFAAGPEDDVGIGLDLHGHGGVGVVGRLGDERAARPRTRIGELAREQVEGGGDRDGHVDRELDRWTAERDFFQEVHSEGEEAPGQGAEAHEKEREEVQPREERLHFWVHLLVALLKKVPSKKLRWVFEKSATLKHSKNCGYLQLVATRYDEVDKK